MRLRYDIYMYTIHICNYEYIYNSSDKKKFGSTIHLHKLRVSLCIVQSTDQIVSRILSCFITHNEDFLKLIGVSVFIRYCLSHYIVKLTM